VNKHSDISAYNLTFLKDFIKTVALNINEAAYQLISSHFNHSEKSAYDKVKSEYSKLIALNEF